MDKTNYDIEKTKDKLKVEEGAEAYKVTQRFTYADYLALPDDKRWEVIDGISYAMGAPTVKHQRILVKLALRFGHYLDEKSCDVFIAPIDVRLNDHSDEDPFIQPDLLVVCDKNKVGERIIKGAPDLMIEILSPSTAHRDRTVKRELYQKYGVKEYWIVDPISESITIHLLNELEKYEGKRYEKNEIIQIHVLKDLRIKVSDVFTDA